MDKTYDVEPWLLLSEQTRLNGFRRIVSRRYRMPSGEESDWDILDSGPTVSVVAVTHADQVILVRQFRPGPRKLLLELPGGYIDQGESVENAAARELLEETGYQASSIEVVSSTWLSAYATNQQFTVVARGCQRVANPMPDREEFLKPTELSVQEFVAHALAGELTDQTHALRGLVALGKLTPTQ